MQTATIPDVDLEAWLAGEIEQPCEAWNFVIGESCGKPAAWLMYLSCCYARSRFACTECKGVCDHIPPRCTLCESDITVTWRERIR